MNIDAPPDAALRAVGPLPAGHPPVKTGKLGVLLLNLGTPDATDYWSMRRYLKEFLSDRRVIETPRWLWWPILNLIILSVRPKPEGARTTRRSGTRSGTRARCAPSRARRPSSSPPRWPGEGDRVVVDWAMRYGNPSTPSRIKALMEQGCDRILLVPLYPQSCAATTATACDKAFETLMQMRWQPAVRVAPPWHDDPVYIEALAKTVRAQARRARLRAGHDRRRPSTACRWTTC